MNRLPFRNRLRRWLDRLLHRWGYCSQEELLREAFTDVEVQLAWEELAERLRARELDQRFHYFRLTILDEEEVFVFGMN